MRVALSVLRAAGHVSDDFFCGFVDWHVTGVDKVRLTKVAVKAVPLKDDDDGSQVSSTVRNCGRQRGAARSSLRRRRRASLCGKSSFLLDGQWRCEVALVLC